jgi:hypothetical protein
MDIKTAWKQLTREQREDLARACDTTVGRLANIVYGCSNCPTDVAMQVELWTSVNLGHHQTVTRFDLISDLDLIRRTWPTLRAPDSAGVELAQAGP